MKGFNAFLSKELRESVRTKRMMILLIVFLAFGIMNAALAKLTPAILEMVSEDYDQMGLKIEPFTVTALDSWGQFAKNVPTALIIVVIMFSGIYTSEYSKGTLIPLITKGLSRASVVFSKFVVMLLIWSAGMWLCYGVTYFYSSYYWDIFQVKELGFSGLCIWLFGVFMLSCIVFFSSFAGSGAQVMLGTGGVYLVMETAGLFGKVNEYLPTRLLDVLPLYKWERDPAEYGTAVVLTAAASAVLIIAALPLTHRRQM